MKKPLSTLERMIRGFSVLLVVVMLIGSATFATNVRAASTITVNSTADNTTSDIFCTLREAINNANADLDTTSGGCIAGTGTDTIIFANSLGTATITLASMLPVITDGGGLTIDGDNRITLSGNDSVQVFYVNAGALLTLQSISVTHGSSATQGGGLLNFGTVTIAYSAFSKNFATSSGGGVMNQSSGTITILNSAFLNNSANFGGGMIGCSASCDFDTSACELAGDVVVVLNEISSSGDDEIEIFNAGRAAADLSGWILTDELTAFE